MGGGKPGRLLRGRPLAGYPAAALALVCERVVIVAKAGEELPELPGVERWDEPDEPRHPLTGIIEALMRAESERVLVCAADMPWVTPLALQRLLAEPGTAVAVSDGRLQPVLAVYDPADLDALKASPRDAPLTRTVERLKPARVELPAALTRGIDTPEELAAANENETGPAEAGPESGTGAL
jgi:molybdopterin-guanine dinucleotide biosynthesis protein A